MKKSVFLTQLRDALGGIPSADAEERIAFYAEMIDDRMEDGLSEEEAVAAVGTVEEIVAQIVAQTPLTKLVKEKMRPKKSLPAWEIVLLIIGVPVWGSLLVAALAVVFSLYVSLWSVAMSLWSVFAALVGSAFGCVVGGIGFAVGGFVPTGLATVAAGLMCAGLSVFAFFGCREVSKGLVLLTKKAILSTKNRLAKKEGAQ